MAEHSPGNSSIEQGRFPPSDTEERPGQGCTGPGSDGCMQWSPMRLATGL